MVHDPHLQENLAFDGELAAGPAITDSVAGPAHADRGDE